MGGGEEQLGTLIIPQLKKPDSIGFSVVSGRFSVIFKDRVSFGFSKVLVVSAKNDQPIKLSIFGIQKLVSCAIGEV